MAKRGRKRKEDVLPNNLNFWTYTLTKPEEVHQFLLRGNNRQKTEILIVLNYIKKTDDILFEQIRGAVWLDKFSKAVIKED